VNIGGLLEPKGTRLQFPASHSNALNHWLQGYREAGLQRDKKRWPIILGRARRDIYVCDEAGNVDLDGW
jgi:hypothetical protein